MSWVIYTSIIAVIAVLLAIWFDRSSRSIIEYNNKLSIERISKKDGKASVLLLIAHPDDESMFFSPTLMTLTSKPDVFEVNILCLSTCNSDRRDTREKELIRAAHVLGLNEKNVRFGNFIDGENWDTEEVSRAILDYITEYKVDTILTFDENGVSGHKNHISCYKGVLGLLKKNKISNLRGLFLKTSTIFQKYSIHTLFPLIVKTIGNDGKIVVVNQNIKNTYNAMKEHGSQLVWFRKLYLLFSHYVYYNELSMM